MRQKKHSLGKATYFSCNVHLTYGITIFSHKLAAQFDSEIAKIVAAIEKLKANNKPKVDISLPIFLSFHFFPF